jgi:hypothetical protein
MAAVRDGEADVAELRTEQLSRDDLLARVAKQ